MKLQIDVVLLLNSTLNNNLNFLDTLTWVQQSENEFIYMKKG